MVNTDNSSEFITQPSKKIDDYTVTTILPIKYKDDIKNIKVYGVQEGKNIAFIVYTRNNNIDDAISSLYNIKHLNLAQSSIFHFDDVGKIKFTNITYNEMNSKTIEKIIKKELATIIEKYRKPIIREKLILAKKLKDAKERNKKKSIITKRRPGR